MTRFIDDVSNLAIEDCLIGKLSTLFRSRNVMEMSVEDVSRLAGETQESALERQRLEAKRKILKTGLQSLKSLNKRKSAASPTETTRVASDDSPPISVMTPSRSDKESVISHSPRVGPRAANSGERTPFPDTTEKMDCEWSPQIALDDNTDLWAHVK